MSPKARTMALYRLMGYEVADVERRLPIPGRFVTQDAFQFADLICISEAQTIAVQATSATNLAAHVKKVAALPAAALWLSGPGRMLVLATWKGLDFRLTGLTILSGAVVVRGLDSRGHLYSDRKRFDWREE